MPWDGPIRRLHDGLVEKGELLFTQSLFVNGPVIKFHSAVVKVTEGSEAKVMVVRYIDQPTVPQGNSKDIALRYMREYDEIMKHLSKAAVSHPYIAILYGRTSGSPLERTTALKVHPVIIPASKWSLTNSDITTSTGIALKLMDAAAHLSRHGIDWVPQAKGACIDQRGEPIIGFDMDLQKRVPENVVAVYQAQIDSIVIVYGKLPCTETDVTQRHENIKEVRCRLAMALRYSSQFNASALGTAQSVSRTLPTLSSAHKISIYIPRSDFLTYLHTPNLRLGGSDDYLTNVNTVLDGVTWHQPCRWARILSLISKPIECKEYIADYCLSDNGDQLLITSFSSAQRATKVHIDIYSVDIPDERRDRTRAALNIASRVVDPLSPSVRLF